MKPRLDMNKIAKGLGAERRGPVSAKGGYFGALGTAADLAARLKVPENGGRRTDPSWTERRQLPLRRQTLERLQRLAARIRKQGGDLHPMQLAALLLEKATQDLSDDEVLGLVDDRR